MRSVSWCTVPHAPACPPWKKNVATPPDTVPLVCCVIGTFAVGDGLGFFVDGLAFFVGVLDWPFDLDLDLLLFADGFSERLSTSLWISASTVLSVSSAVSVADASGSAVIVAEATSVAVSSDDSEEFVALASVASSAEESVELAGVKSSTESVDDEARDVEAGADLDKVADTDCDCAALLCWWRWSCPWLGL
jgi:hypothetical protein